MEPLKVKDSVVAKDPSRRAFLPPTGSSDFGSGAPPILHSFFFSSTVFVALVEDQRSGALTID